MTRRLLCLAFALIAPMTLLAQTTGSLTGRVVDDEGKPQIGAVIKILGTRQGGLSKAPDGRFTIAGIRAGDYTVEVSVMGQQKVQRPVRISIGATTDLGTIKLGTGSVQAKTTVVTGRRSEEVQRERTGTVRQVSKEEIDQSARTDIVGMVSQQGSVSTGGVNGFSIRGGRATETSIRVDGVDVGDPFVGSFGNTSASLYPTVSVLAVQEVQVIPSGFSAEFGDVLSGMVNSVTRAGSQDRYEGIFRYRTQVPALYGYSDDVTVQKAGTDIDTVLKGVQRLGSGSQLYEFGFGGPFPGLTDDQGRAMLTFYITGKYNPIPYTSASYDVLDMSPEFAAQRAPIARELWGYALEPSNIGQIEGQESIIHDINGKFKLFLSDDIFMEFGGELGLTTREFADWSLLYQLDHPAVMTLNPDGTVNDSASYATNPATGRIDYSKPLKFNTDLVERDMQAIDQNTIINRYFARYFQNLDQATYIDITGSYVRNRYEVGKKIEKDYGIFEAFDIQAPIDADADKMIDVYEAPTGTTVLNQYVRQDNPTQIQLRNPYTGLYEGGESSGASHNPYGIIDLNFPTHGNDRNLDMRQSTVITLKGTYETNFDLDDIRTQIKAGFDFSTYELVRHYNSLPWDKLPFFDVYGETAPYYDEKRPDDVALRDFLADPFTPFDGALWVQTRFDYKSILFQPGVRFDFISPNTKVGPALRRDNSQVVESINSSEDASLKFQVSPRIGVSYPVTESSQFRVNFAMMFKMPEFNWMFDNAYGNSQRGNQVFGDPNIDPQKVFNYEIGYSASFDEGLYFFDAVAFYRDIYNQTGITFIPAVPSPYMVYSVQEYGSVRGLELQIGRAMSDNFRADVSYSLQRAVGTASSPGANYSQLIGGVDPNTGENRTAPLTEYPLSYDRTHAVNATVAVQWNKDEGPTIGGIPLLENTTISITGSFSSGLPYTKYDVKGVQVGEYNAERSPSVFGTEGHIERRIPLRDIFGESIGNLEISVFADVFNILNTTGPVGYYATTGSPTNNGTSLDRKLGDFISTPYFREIHPARPETYDLRQYDRFGQRYYNPYADLNLDGVVTQLERYEGYQRFVSTYQNAYARNNFQTPRTVAVGVKVRF